MKKFSDAPTFGDAYAEAMAAENEIFRLTDRLRDQVWKTLRQVSLESILKTLPAATTMNEPDKHHLCAPYWQSNAHYSGIAFSTSPLGRVLEVQVWRDKEITYLNVYYVTGVEQKTSGGVYFKKRSGKLKHLYDVLVEEWRERKAAR